ncbi:MAG: CDC27 family protein [Pseudomonadota bacterium]
MQAADMTSTPYNQAVVFYDAQNYVEALALAKSAIDDTPQGLQYLYIAVRCYILLKKFEEALALLGKTQTPTDTKNVFSTQLESIALTCEALLGAKRYDQASALLLQVHDAGYLNARQSFQLVYCLSIVGRKEEAKALLLHYSDFARSSSENALENLILIQKLNDIRLETHFCEMIWQHFRADLVNDELAWLLGLIMMCHGKWRTGSLLHERRFAAKKIDVQTYVPCAKLWQGEPIKGKVVLIYGDQGMGDNINFCRFARNLHAMRPAKLIYAVMAGAVPLLAELEYLDETIALENIPDSGIDYFVPSTSLIHRLEITPDKVATPLPMWNFGQKMCKSFIRPANRKPRVGFFWKGNPNTQSDNERSVPTENFQEVLSLSGIKFFGLQWGMSSQELSEIFDHPLRSLGDKLYDMKAAAKVIAQMDLLIGCDSAYIHLAGAMGVPAWVLVSASPDWRWGRDREDTIWYDSVRVIRQTHDGQWHDVVSRVCQDLHDIFGT